MASVRFLGAASEVGRSGFVVDVGEKILLDYGVKLTPKGIEYPLPVTENLAAVVISHAHLDHTGQLPHLFTKSNTMTYMTPPTLELSKMLWFDTLKIAGLEAMDASFSKQEIHAVEKFTFAVHYNRKLKVGENTSIELTDAGHIAGSAITKLTSPRDKTIVYTGDIRLDDTRLQVGADLPKGDCDALIIESTYGDRDHDDRKETEKTFVGDIQDTIDRGGTALVSSFAVGRSAEMVDILNEYNLNADIYLDGMCQKAARIYMSYPKYIRNPSFLKKSLDRAHWVKNISMRKAALKKPSVIVTTSGMLQGGPVYAYLPEIYKDENSKLFLTGYQVEGTPGRILLETGKINLNGIVVKPKMKVEKYDFSSHAGKSELLKIIAKLNPKKVVLVHGDIEVMKKLLKTLKSEGFDAVAPHIGDELVI